MLKKLTKLSFTLVLLLFLSSSVVHASGKMQVALGEKVSLQAEDVKGGTFKWVAKKGKDIMSTQETSVFSYTFDQQGEYIVSLAVTDAAGNTKNTDVMVNVGGSYSAPAATGGETEGNLANVPLSVNYDTLPMQNAERTIHILGTEGRVVFDIGTRDDIIEYRVDRNIYLDSDGNGIANDDIDNANDPSYLRGGMWQTTYKASESTKIAAEITVVSKTGEKAKTQVQIVFDPLPSKQGNVVAVLDTLPAPDPQTNKIVLYGQSGTVAFYPMRSQGDIVEYRIDKNIFVDSDGNGNPADDIDNFNDASFKTGDVWTTTYEKTDQQVIAQLIVVGRNGTGSRIQREIVFAEKPAPTPTPVSGQAGGTEPAIKLTADKQFVQKGDPVTFTVTGLTQSMDSYTFDWDFNGDGKIDQTVEGNNTVTYIYDTPGDQNVKVTVTDKDKNQAAFALTMPVKDIQATTADFESKVDGMTVTFTNLSAANSELSNKALTYTWSFGDPDAQNYEAQKDKISIQNPVYTYTKAGTYVVTLTVADADLVASTKTDKVEIKTAAPEANAPEANAGKAQVTSGGVSGGSVIGTIFKVILYVILGIVLLVVLIIAGLLVFLKIQHPDLVFEELIDELKIKMLGMLGVHEMLEHGESAAGELTSQSATAKSFEASARAKPAPGKETAPAEEEHQEEPAPEAPVPEAPEVPTPETPPESAPSESSVPDWLKQTTPAGVTPSSSPAATETPTIIEGEVVEEEPAQKQPGTEQGPVPDWLKNA